MHTRVVLPNVRRPLLPIFLFRGELDAHDVRFGRDDGRDERTPSEAVLGSASAGGSVSVSGTGNNFDA